MLDVKDVKDAKFKSHRNKRAKTSCPGQKLNLNMHRK